MDTGKSMLPWIKRGKNDNEASSSRAHCLTSVSFLFTLVLHLKGNFELGLGSDVRYIGGFIKYVKNVDMLKFTLANLTMILAWIFNSMRGYTPILGWYQGVQGRFPEDLIPICFEEDIREMFSVMSRHDLDTIDLYFVDPTTIYLPKSKGGFFAIPWNVPKCEKPLIYEDLEYHQLRHLNSESLNFILSDNESSDGYHEETEEVPNMQTIEGHGGAILQDTNSNDGVQFVNQLPDNLQIGDNDLSDETEDSEDDIHVQGTENQDVGLQLQPAHIEEGPSRKKFLIHFLFGGRFGRNRKSARVEYMYGKAGYVEVQDATNFTLVDLLRGYLRLSRGRFPDPKLIWIVTRNVSWPHCLRPVVNDNDVMMMDTRANKFADSPIAVQLFAQDEIEVAGNRFRQHYALPVDMEYEFIDPSYMERARALETAYRLQGGSNEGLSWAIGGPPRTWRPSQKKWYHKS